MLLDSKGQVGKRDDAHEDEMQQNEERKEMVPDFHMRHPSPTKRDMAA